MATSMDIMEIKLIPKAVLRALLNAKPFLLSIMVSSITLVIRPLMMASVRTNKV